MTCRRDHTPTVVAVAFAAIGVAAATTTTLIGLRIAGVVDWSAWIVLAPMWIVGGAVLLALMVVVWVLLAIGVQDLRAQRRETDQEMTAAREHLNTVRLDAVRRTARPSEHGPARKWGGQR